MHSGFYTGWRYGLCDTATRTDEAKLPDQSLSCDNGLGTLARLTIPENRRMAIITRNTDEAVTTYLSCDRVEIFKEEYWMQSERVPHLT